MTYTFSSQRASWVFSAEQLEDLRCSSRGEGGLTRDEEGALLRQSQVQMQDLARKMGLPRQVASAALLFFKRFFVRHTVVHCVPQHLMAACLMAAVKAEECPMFQSSETPFSASKFLASMERALGRQLLSASELVRLESVLLEGLGFSLTAYTPVQAVRGGLRLLKHAAKLTEEEVKRVTERAVAAAEEACLSDAPLLFHPGELALACLRSAMTGGDLPARFDAFLASAATESASVRHGKAEKVRGMEAEGAAFRLSDTGAGGGVGAEAGDGNGVGPEGGNGVGPEGSAEHEGGVVSLQERMSQADAVIAKAKEELEADKKRNLGAVVQKLKRCREAGQGQGGGEGAGKAKKRKKGGSEDSAPG